MGRYNSPLSRQHYWGLSVLFLAVVLVAGDFTAFSPALPAIAHSFSSDIATIHWVVNAYSLIYGVIIVASGRFADIYGRRRIFLVGVFIFAISSLAGGLAEKLWVLFLCRALMGLAGALIWSAVLGMAYNLLPQERASFAGGVILAALGLATACGPVLGGFFTEYLSWRWILFINVPIALLVFLLGWNKYPVDTFGKVNNHIDYLSMLALSISLFCFLLAMDVLAQYSIKNFLVLLLLSAFILLFLAFVYTEKRAKTNALVPLGLIENASFLSAGFSVMLVAAAFFATLVYIPLLFISVHHYSALQAGVALLPMMVTSGVFAFISGFLHEKLGARLLICVGALGMSIGLFWLSTLKGEMSYFQFVPALLLIGTSLGIYSPAVVTAAVTVVDPAESSLAGAVIYMFRFLGGAIALGINATILAVAHDLETGIYRAFFVDGIVAFIGFLIPLVFYKDQLIKIFRE
ncbi:putative multidrug resistance protein MdtD [Microbulbifer sp. NBRC 101763]|uniref:MFS transporter n=1 Tax=Microbulbifer sp. NBRC 101763 TaxID=1113820 RepID=UPI0030A0934D